MKMKQVTLHITDKKFSLFMELIKSLDFVKKVDAETEPSKAQILRGIKEAVNEVNLIKTGKLKGRSAEELFDEL